MYVNKSRFFDISKYLAKRVNMWENHKVNVSLAEPPFSELHHHQHYHAACVRVGPNINNSPLITQFSSFFLNEASNLFQSIWTAILVSKEMGEELQFIHNRKTVSSFLTLTSSLIPSWFGHTRFSMPTKY